MSLYILESEKRANTCNAVSVQYLVHNLLRLRAYLVHLSNTPEYYNAFDVFNMDDGEVLMSFVDLHKKGGTV